MGWTPTLVVLVVSLMIFFGARYQAAKPVELGKARLLPYTAIMFLAAIIFILMVTHIFTLLGLGGGHLQGLAPAEPIYLAQKI